MLGFAPIASATLGGSGVARPVINSAVSGLSSQVSFGLISVKANSTISEIAIRKPDTTFFYDPNNDGVGSFRNNEHPFVSFANYFILGFDPALATTPNNSLAPSWSGTYPHAEKFKITASITDGPITYQGAHAPLVNGDYTFPATVNDAGLAQYRQPPHLRHLPETITNSAATISSLADPLIATVTFPANDLSLFNVIVGQVRTINTFDPTDSDTFFDSLINGFAGDILLPGENKSRELFHLSPDKGLEIGSVSVGTFGTDNTSLINGAAWVLYGLKLQPQTTATHNADGTPVSQEHTLLVTASIGAVQANVGFTPASFGITAALGSTQANVAEPLTGFQIGTMLTPDPAWYLNPSRVQLVARANQSADSAVYPYSPGPFDTGPLQNEFNISASLGTLAGPIGVDVPVPSVSATTTLGVVAVSADNLLTMPSLQATISTSLNDAQANVTEILSSSFSASISLGTTSQSATSNAVATTLTATLSTRALTASGDANTGVTSGVSATTSLGIITLIITRYTSISASLSVTQTVVARNFIDAEALPQVAVSAETLAGFFRDGQAATAASCSVTATGRLLWEPVAAAGADPWATVNTSEADPWIPQSGGNVETPANIWQNAA
jgi:hypothetical protein